MSEATSFLVALRLDGKRCLVLGSGAEAARRARELSAAGAAVVAIGAAPCPELELLASDGRISVERRAFVEADLDDGWLVVLADRDPELLARVGPACQARRLLFCAVDQPGHNSFNHVAVARAGRVSVAVSTDGGAPALAKRLRDELERALSAADVAGFFEELSALRARTAPAERKRVLTEAAGRLSLTGIEIARDPGGDAEE